jgi:uracil-DNA glycosylase
MATDSRENIDVNFKTVSEAIDAMRNSMQFLSDMGCRRIDCSQKSVQTVLSWTDRQAATGVGLRSLTDIRNDLGDCRRCGLSKKRNRIVFGAGDAHAKLVFIGEGPGYDEDRQGEPFVGAAGQLLTRIIHAINMTRDRVYICNIIKCRPPGNRNPSPDEIKTCYPFLKRQISAIKPEFICALGSVAAQTLLQTDQSISKLRGKFCSFMNARLIPTYHPVYLLRNPGKKRDVWEDMKKLMKEMGDRPWYTAPEDQ